MTTNLCPRCGGDVPAGLDCEKPHCAALDKQHKAHVEAERLGRLAYNFFARTQGIETSWTELCEPCRVLWRVATIVTTGDERRRA